VLSGDHIYKMNYHEMLDWHRAHKAEITIATIQTPPEDAADSGWWRLARTAAWWGSRRSPSTAIPNARGSTRP